MGESFSTHCQSCDDYKQFLIGVGMIYSSIEDLLFVYPTILRKNVRTNVQEILKGNTILSEDMYHAVYLCQKCETLHSRFYLKFECEDGQHFETKFQCPDCRGKLVGLTESEQRAIDVRKFRCRKCRKKNLFPDLGPLWD